MDTVMLNTRQRVDLVDQVKKVARERKVTITEVVRDSLMEGVKDNERKRGFTGKEWVTMTLQAGTFTLLILVLGLLLS